MPHVGWNSLEPQQRGSIVDGVAPGAQVYFTHSYVGAVTGDTVAVTEHGEPFAAVVQRGHVAGVQFHPEKSGDVGLQILRNFLELVRMSRREISGPCSQSLPMLSKRIIACLDVRDGQVVKGINFEGLRIAGDPAELARRYNARASTSWSSSTSRRRSSAAARWPTRSRAVARELFIPLAVGGGIRTEDDAAAAVDAGADKVSLNTAALAEPGADHDARRPLRQPGGRRRDRREARVGGQRLFAVYARSGTDRRRPRRGRVGARSRRRAAPARFC